MFCFFSVFRLTDAHKLMIRVIRKIKFFVARRKFQVNDNHWLAVKWTRKEENYERIQFMYAEIYRHITSFDFGIAIVLLRFSISLLRLLLFRSFFSLSFFLLMHSVWSK